MRQSCMPQPGDRRQPPKAAAAAACWLTAARSPTSRSCTRYGGDP